MVERDLAKVDVAGSIPVFRSNLKIMQYLTAVAATHLRKWLNGRARPCQGRCCGFDSRFPLDDEAI